MGNNKWWNDGNVCIRIIFIVVFNCLLGKILFYNNEWMNNCCLSPIQQFFSYIMPRREQLGFQWDDDEVRFVLDQHAKLDFYSVG